MKKKRTSERDARLGETVSHAGNTACALSFIRLAGGPDALGKRGSSRCCFGLDVLPLPSESGREDAQRSMPAMLGCVRPECKASCHPERNERPAPAVD
eukprot:2943960-Rhodomonas_salina.2